jgi:hypothetical protein
MLKADQYSSGGMKMRKTTSGESVGLRRLLGVSPDF